MTILQLKLVMPLMLLETRRVITAVVDCPDAKVEPSLSQKMVMGPFAFVGFQLFVVILRVICALPVFFM